MTTLYIAHIDYGMYTAGMRTPALDSRDFEELRALARATPAARRQHRLHAVMLVAGGLSCRAVAGLLGDSPRSIEYWVQRYKVNKYKGLKDKIRPGRPSCLSAGQRAQVVDALAAPPSQQSASGLSWNGPALRAYLKRVYGVTLGLRQTQRLIAELGS